MRLDILSSKPYTSVIPGFVANLIKDNLLNDLCGKTLGTLSFFSATRKGNMGKYVLRDNLTDVIKIMSFNTGMNTAKVNPMRFKIKAWKQFWFVEKVSVLG